MADDVFARMRACTCPGQPHEEGDGVWLRPTISLSGGLALERDMTEVTDAARARGDASVMGVAGDLTGRWLSTCIRYGALGWNVVDDDGPVAFDVEALIADYTLSRPVADVAAELYTDAVLSPLADRLSGRSPNGPMDGSTSRKARSTRKPSRRSLPATTAASAPSPP